MFVLVLHEQTTLIISHNDIINWAIQVAQGIEYLHSLNIVHGNIEPGR